MQIFLPKKIVLLFFFCFFSVLSIAQLNITPQTTANALAQSLVGTGITISNVTFTGNPLMAGYFRAQNNAGLGIDTGIVLTNGRAKTTGGNTGVNDDAGQLASTGWSLAGDANLATAISSPVGDLHDACILEFDFVPLGDSIKFNYVFSSEEYTPAFACPDLSGGGYNDAFAFFISGPGFPTLQNIALVPGTSLPVSIFNVNNVPDFSGTALCPNNPTYYVDNPSNAYFSHDGHTTVLRALAVVQPCQTYHLKLVISDVGDGVWDSGVFLEAGSLSSNILALTTVTDLDTSGINYLVEGCRPGTITIKRQSITPFPQVVNLYYNGTAINGVDVQTLPPSVTIPANQDSVLLNLIPIVDNVEEGIELLEISNLPPCASTGSPQNTIIIQIRDYDTLTIGPGRNPDTAFICRNAVLPLVANSGYTNYDWTPNINLSNANIQNPLATLTDSIANYFCTATVGTCVAKDSLNIKWKQIWLQSKTDILCNNGTTGKILVRTSTGWQAPVVFQANSGAWQSSPMFNNLSEGNYVVRVKDASGCMDSIVVNLVQSYPDLLVNAIDTTLASCSGNPEATSTIQAGGGRTPYTYSINNGTVSTPFQASNIFNVLQGNYTITIKDANGCIVTDLRTIALKNDLTMSFTGVPVICEGTSSNPLPLVSNAISYLWWPSGGLSSTNVKNPIANPVVTTKYYVKGTKGVCISTDSIIVNVNPAPIPNAGADKTICFGGNTSLTGSGGTQFNWRPVTYLDDIHAASPNVINPIDNKSYYLEVIDVNGCISLFEDTVKLSVTPAVKLFAGYDTVAAMGQPVQLFAYEVGNSGVIRYSWEPSTGLNDATIGSPVATLYNDVVYYVTGYTSENCKGSAVVKVKVYKGPDIYVPTAFTPNGDGLNDLLKAIPVGMKINQYFKIYNRWGHQVFATSDFHRGWNGRLKDGNVSTGTYVWVAQGIDYLGRTVFRRGSVLVLP
ncbi:MAG: choice-of-anchor L domain-containing protein [Chitinophagaceae bacterium]|nr:choice-of-anchor L domain-containing protein [Chitinophagaceae bacterium]